MMKIFQMLSELIGFNAQRCVEVKNGADRQTKIALAKVCLLNQTINIFV